MKIYATHWHVRLRRIRKIVLLMKLIIILLMTAFLQVSFAGNAQTVTLKAKAMPLQDLLEQVQQQTGYRFLLTDEMLKGTHAVTLNVSNASLAEILKAALKGQPLNYEIKENTIILSRKPTEASVEVTSVKVTGVVTDDSNQSLPGVTVKVAGTQIATTTDVDGKFSINVPDNNATLEFSFVGFKTQTVKINGNGVITVKLQATVKSLEDVVVIGYGAQRGADVTSAVTNIKAKDFVQAPVTDAAELIKAKVAGLTILNPNGDPNAQSQVLLRGTNTINGANTGVLVIVDGVPGNLLTVAPEDIADISVLKDGSSAAIYGVQGSNGVIIITTKHATGENINRVNYMGSESVSQITKEPKLLTAADIRNLIKTGAYSSAFDKGYSTDWIKALSKSFPVSSVQSLSFNGGNSQTNYLASLNYRFLNGIFKQSNHSQLTGRVDINHSMFNGKLKFNFGMTETNFSDIPFNAYDYRQATYMNPTAPVKEPNGSYYEEPGNFDYQNPISDIYNTYQPQNSYNDKYNASITVLPISGLRITALGAYTKNGYENTSYQNMENISTIRSQQFGVASIYQGQAVQRFLNFTAEYTKDLGDHRFTLLGGYEYTDYDSFGTTIVNHDFPTDYYGVNQIQLGQAQKNGQDVIGSGRSVSNLISYFVRGTYNYKEKYLLLASLRVDGASQLYGSKEPYGKFPSVQLGWRVTKEDFMQNQQIFDDLKIRAGYGVTGNQPALSFLGVGLLQYGNYVLYNNQWIQTLSPSQNANPDIRWEEKREKDLGADFSMFKGLITGTIDYYDRKIVGLLYNYQVPSPPNLFNSTEANVGTMQNKGIEASISVTPVKNSAFKWTSTVLFSTNNNKLISLSNDLYKTTSNYFPTGYTGPPMQTTTHIVQVGQQIGDFYGFKVVGVDKNGYWMYQEPNGKVVSYNDFNHAFSDKQVIGNGLPKFYGGWNNTFSYKNWDLSITQRGAFKFQIMNTQRMFLENPGANSYNRLASAFQPLFGTAVLNKNVPQEYNSYYIENGDYWKIDNITLGYSFRNWKSKYIHNPRIAFSTLNTFVFTKYKGSDPEVDEGGLTPGIDNKDAYPSIRTFTLSLSANF